MHTLLNDLRFTFRSLFRNYGFTVVVLLTLALSIGAATAIFSVVNAVLFRPLPFPDSDQLAIVWETQPQLDNAPVTPATFLDWKERNQVFQYVAAYKGQSFNLTGQDEPERVRGIAVSSDFFSLLGVSPRQGRAFLPEDDKPGADPVVIISHGFWQRRFGSDENLVGKRITLNGRSSTVIGVMPEEGQFPRTSEIWAPMAMSPAEMQIRDTHYLSVIARLKPGIKPQQAQAEMDVIANQLQQEYPANTGKGVKIVPLYEQVVSGVRPALKILLSAVGFVVLIACANVANLLLARASVRRKEMAIRAAIGATRSRILRQLLTESFVLAFLGGAMGLLLAYWATPLLIAISPGSIPRSTEIGVDFWVLGFTLAITLTTGLAFGLVPAIQLSKPNLNEILKDANRSQIGGFRRLSLRNLLVTSEVALALMLLIGAGLMIRSFLRLQGVESGFYPANVLTLQITLPASKYSDSNRRVAFVREASERIRNVPGVESCGTINFLPLSGNGSSTTFVIEGRPDPTANDKPLSEYRIVSAGYFQTMKIALRSGRFIGEEDHEKANGTTVINETLARRYFPDEDPIGKRIGLSGPVDWREIVGVVADVKDYGLEAEPKPVCYIPLPQATSPYSQYSTMALVTRTISDPLKLTTAIRSAIQSVDKDQPVYNITTMEQLLAGVVAQPRLYMLLLSIFAGVALVLSLVGIYGVMAYSVKQRTYEIGMRMAMGAQQRDILKMIISQAMAMTLAGIVIGLAGSFALTRLMISMLYGVSPTDLTTFAGVSLLLIGVAMIASFIPARRATEVSPLSAIRYS